MSAQSDPKKIIGMALTVIGILLLAFGILKGIASPTDIDDNKGINLIGTNKTNELKLDAAAVIIGWLAILIGPALWFGETPAVIRKAAGR